MIEPVVGRAKKEQERKFREGFSDGVEDALRLMEPFLSDDKVAQLKRWLRGPISEWRFDPDLAFNEPPPSPLCLRDEEASDWERLSQSTMAI
jgi:hypothetical protein